MQISEIRPGLKLATEQLPFVRSAALGFWVRSGVAHEPAALQGASHFLEHLVFKGTPSRTAREISESFDDIGGEVNAYTAKEYTCFYCKVVDEHLPRALEILTDMVCHARLDSDDINKERNVILEEVGMYEDSPEEYVHDLLAQAVWPESALGRAILGTRQTLTELSAKKLRQYYQEHYSARNTVIAAAGSVEHQRLATQLAELVDLADRPATADGNHLGGLPGAPLLVERSTEQLHLALGLPGLALDDEQLYAWNLLNNILGSGMSSRIFQRLREEHALVYSAYSYTASFRLAGYSAIYLGLAPKNLAQALALISRELRSLSQELVAPEELRRAQAQVKGALIMGLESTANRMSRMGRGLLMLGKVQEIEQIIAKIEQVTADDLRELARRLFNRELLTAAAVGNVKQVPELLASFNW